MRNWVFPATNRNGSSWVKTLPTFVAPGIGGWARALVWATLALLVFLSLIGAVQAQEAGIIEGQVINGTAGGPEVGVGLPVLLHVFRGEVEQDTLETGTDLSGRFLFGGLDTDADLEYWPEVVYLDVSYSSAEPLQFGDDQANLTATVTVYETTDDDSVLRLDSVHAIAESFGEVLRISEIHLFGNTGDRTFVGDGDDGGQGTTVFIPLPQEAVGLAFGEEAETERFVEVAGGLMDTEPVLPGSESSLAFFSYHLMVPGKTVPLERRFAYPVTILNMLVAQPGLTLNSDRLQSRGIELFQGRQYEFYATQNLDPETPLILEFVPVPETASGTVPGGMPSSSGQGVTSGSTRGSQGVLLWLGFGLAALAVFGAIVYSMAVRRPAAAHASAPDLAANPQARLLLAELADLDEAFESGRVDNAAYERQRAEKYRELKSL